MDFLRLILLICSTTFLAGIGCAAITYLMEFYQRILNATFYRIINSYDPFKTARSVRKVHEKLGELDGPVYTFVKTDKKANIKWGVRHYLPRRH